MKPSPSSDPYEQGGLSSNKHVTIALRKCYKALIDSGAAISLVRYSMYQNIDNSLKTLMQITSVQLNTSDGSLVTALGITTLQLRIADLNSPTLSWCDRLPDMELLFGIDKQKKFTISYAWD